MFKKIFLFILLIIIVFSVSFFIGFKKKEFPQNDQVKQVKLFYYSPSKDVDESGNILCSEKGLVSVDRAVESENYIEETIKLLLAGEISERELKELKINTEFPLERFELLSASLDEGLLTLEFSDPMNETIGGACRVGVMHAQIIATAGQFDEVLEVKIIPEDTLFQP